MEDIKEQVAKQNAFAAKSTLSNGESFRNPDPHGVDRLQGIPRKQIISDDANPCTKGTY